MRVWPLIALTLAGLLSASEQSYPLWDGHESVADYAKRVNLPPTKTLDLGGGVKMDLVLIPAGKFIMGTPEPTKPTEVLEPPELPEPSPIDEDGFQNKIINGQLLLSVSAIALLVMLCVIIVVANRKRQRPKYSLLGLLLMTVIAGGSGLYWRQSVRKLEEARLQHTAAKEHFNAARTQHRAAKERFDAAQAQYMAAKVEYDAAYPSEKPGHWVTLTNPFYMGKYDVTQDQYQQVIGTNPSQFIGKDNPVETLFWGDVQSFCKKVMEQSKQTVRLPTEAEWEFACRAGTTTMYYSGDTEADLARVAWYHSNSNDTTHPVGQKEPNKFGLYDMHGNVWQRCQDRWEDDYSKASSENPQGAADNGAACVSRGGSWFNPTDCRSACRWWDPGCRYSFIGFRVVVPAFKTP